ncbi:unnamed protein product [Boreogadus saida]
MRCRAGAPPDLSEETFLTPGSSSSGGPEVRCRPPAVHHLESSRSHRTESVFLELVGPVHRFRSYRSVGQVAPRGATEHRSVVEGEQQGRDSTAGERPQHTACFRDGLRPRRGDKRPGSLTVSVRPSSTPYPSVLNTLPDCPHTPPGPNGGR